MTRATGFPVIRFLVLGLLILAASSLAQERASIADQVARTYGLESFSVSIGS